MSRVGVGSVVRKWNVLECLGAGLFAEVFSCNSNETSTLKAMKVQRRELYNDTMQNEMLLQVYLSYFLSENQKIGIPQVYDFISTPDHDIIVMDYLGPSLNTLIGGSNNKALSLKTVLMIGIRMIRFLKVLHSKRIFHGDLTEDNIAIGPDRFKDILYLIDFGRSILISADGSEEITPDYEMIHNLECSDDDVELPETPLVLNRRNQDLNDCLVMLMVMCNPKRAASVGAHALSSSGQTNWMTRQEMSNFLADFPAELEWFMSYYSLRPSGTDPDYEYMEQIFTDGLKHRGLQDDGIFDWMME